MRPVSPKMDPSGAPSSPELVIPFVVPPGVNLEVQPGIWVSHPGPGPVAVRVVDQRPAVPLHPPTKPGLGELLLEALLTWRRNKRGTVR